MSLASKEALLNIIESHFKNLDKDLKKMSLEDRQMQLKHYAKILTAGDDAISQRTKEVLFEGLEGHYKKMRFYFAHISQEKKVGDLRQFLKLLSPEKIQEVLTNMNENQNIRFE